MGQRFSACLLITASFPLMPGCDSPADTAKQQQPVRPAAPKRRCRPHQRSATSNASGSRTG